MLKVLQNLLDLQSVDAQLREVREHLEAFPEKLAEVEARVAGAKSELDASKAAQVETIRDRKKYELDVEQWKERVRKYRDQTAQVKTNEAYKALQHEVQTAEGEIAKAEDRLLERMVAAEEYDRSVKASEKLLKEVEEVARSARTKIESDKAVMEKELAERTGQRARVVAGIPEDLLDHYDRIAKKHNGVSLAEVKDEKCSACGMRVRPHVFQEMRRRGSDEMFHCETCTRILYYVEPEASEASAAASAAHGESAAAPPSREQ
ncbi:MAG: zinc ribbon domain-containing protein [Candidatus Acidiferrales bacterium]